MISHEEAQALISARLDAPMDPAENRVLLGHLATCASCRQFAEQTNVLARGLRDMPQLAPSPVVSRAVLERISQGRSPWTRFWEGVKLHPAPLAAAAAVIVLLIVGISIFRGIIGDDDDPSGNLAQLNANTQTAQATDTAQITEAANETEPALADAAGDDEETVTTDGDGDNDGQPADSTEPTTDPTQIPPINAEGYTPTDPATTEIQGGAADDAGDTGNSADSGDLGQTAAASGVTEAAGDEGDAADPDTTSAPDTSSDPGENGGQAAGLQPDDDEQPTTEASEPTEPATTEPTPVAGDDSGESEDGDSGIFAAVGPSDSSPIATPAPDSADATPTQVVASVPTARATATPTSTPEPTATEEPTTTPTSEPTETPQATETATLEPSETPEPTETPDPTATATAEPAATERSLATSTPEPTETPDPTSTPEPTETPEPTATVTPEPTETAEPTETPDPTETPAPTETATPEPTSTQEPINTIEPLPTEEPTEEPANDGPPPIVPVEGSDVVEDGSTDSIDEIEPTDETDTGNVAPTDDDEPAPTPDVTEAEPTPDDSQAASVNDEGEPTPAGIGSNGTDQGAASDETEPADETESAAEDDGGPPPIRPIGEDDQDSASGQGDTGDADGDSTETDREGDPTAEVSGRGGPAEDPDAADNAANDTDEGTAETDVDETEAAFDLAAAPAVIGAIPGPASPDGPLRYANGAYVAGVDGGNLAIVSADGGVSGLGQGFYPIWSPGGQLAYTVDDGVSAVVQVAGSGVVSAQGPEDGAAFRDVPAGWSGETPVILRTDRDRASSAELYVAGSSEPFWRREEIGLAGLVPVQVGGGFLVPTTEGWLLVDQGGGEQTLGPVVSGEVGATVIGPNGLLAYLAGGSVWVGTATNPAGASPIAAGTGFDFSPNGDAIAVTDGASLTVYDLGGTVVDRWTPGDGNSVGAPYWNGDGIIVPVGSTLRLVPTSEIGA